MIKGDRLTLRPLKLDDVTEQYLSWLNDPEIQRYTRRRGVVTTLEELQKFMHDSQNSQDAHFAIIVNDGKHHIGNIFLNRVNLVDKNADLSIMIGDRTFHGKGYAQDAIRLLSRYAFETLGLHRLYAASPNEAFDRVVEKLGWTKEGIRRQDFFLDGQYLDMTCWSLLRTDLQKMETV
ncbi:MAG: GNAT family N-acetyltransferase [Patescibacteria group bacterium]